MKHNENFPEFCTQLLPNEWFLGFFTIFPIYLLYLQQVYFRRIAMPKAITKEHVRHKIKTEPKKLSKAALWWKKHPEGAPLIIHDMRAVMR